MRVLATRLTVRRSGLGLSAPTGLRYSSSKPEKRESFAAAVDSVLTADLPRAAKGGSPPPRRHSKHDAKQDAELFAGERVATAQRPKLISNPLANKFGLSKEEFRSELKDMKDLRGARRRANDAERVLLEGPEEKITVGPGYLKYSGPAPETDARYPEMWTANSAVVPYARLRDACPCPKCIHPSTRQKTHTSGEAWREVRDWTGAVDSTVMHIAKNEAGEHGVQVHWPPLGGAPHAAFYPVSLLRRLASRHVRGSPYYLHGVKRELWDRESLLANAPDLWTDYAELQDGKVGEPLKPRPEVFLRILEQLQKYGLAVIRGIPTQETDNKTNSIREFAEAIGPLRNTFYGETWNVQSVANSKNVAYTSLNLGLHMDLCYYQLPPRFQFLHCLRNRVIGGASYFVDSFKAAEYLQQTDPAAYELLAHNAIAYEYDNDGHYMTHTHAVLPGNVHSPRLHNAVFWSPPFQAPPVKVPRAAGRAGGEARSAAERQEAALETEGAYYAALSAFQDALDRPELRYEFTMAEGEAVLFDNNRVLHARTAFRDRTDEELQRDGVQLTPGEPTRWLKGLYLDGSTVWDRMMVLNDQVRGGK